MCGVKVHLCLATDWNAHNVSSWCASKFLPGCLLVEMLLGVHGHCIESLLTL